ncbi:hypothetical protein ACLOJK_017062 [Asimina triloba]
MEKISVSQYHCKNIFLAIIYVIFMLVLSTSVSASSWQLLGSDGGEVYRPDALVSTGLAKLGYEYVNIGWSLRLKGVVALSFR